MKSKFYTQLPILFGALVVSLWGGINAAFASDSAMITTTGNPHQQVTTSTSNGKGYVTNYETTVESGSVTGSGLEWSTPAVLTLTAPEGTVFTGVTLATYGASACLNDYANVQAVVAPLVIGQTTVSIPVTNDFLVAGGDPCVRSIKTLTVTATYAPIIVAPVADCGPHNDKFNLCHNGNQICVAASAVAAHLAHGDSYGACSSNKAPNVTTILASPNPAVGGKFSVRVAAANTGFTQVVLIDMQGNVISELFRGNINAGEQRDFAIDRNLTKGLYLVRVQGGTGVNSIRVEVQE